MEAIPSREEYAQARLQELAVRLGDVAELLERAKLCIYATGSYGRLEAWKESDIDLFFIYESTDSFSYLSFLRVAGRLVESTEAMGFPPFSGDGKYLESLDVNHIERILGSREDDSSNAFTARMLLLLESQPVSDGGRYADLIERIVGFYFRDFEGHESDFIPTFLTNDILRFWRTLALNYEHDRYEVARLQGDEQDTARAKSSLKNYKLKVSRLATCFSMIVHLVSEPVPVTIGRVVALCNMTPQERFQALRGRSSTADGIIDQLREEYERFLACVQTTDSELRSRFATKEYRRARLDEAAQYGDLIFNLVLELAPQSRLRHLVV